jgi:hypothetical protein
VIHKLTEGASGLRWNEARHINRLFAIEHFHALSSWNYATANGKDK